MEKYKPFLAGELLFKPKQKNKSPLVILSCRDIGKWYSVEVFDLEKASVINWCIEKKCKQSFYEFDIIDFSRISENSNSYYSYPLYRLGDYKISEIFYGFQREDLKLTQKYLENLKFCELVEKLSSEKYFYLYPNISKSVSDLKKEIEVMQIGYKKDIKSISDKLLDHLLKDNFLNYLIYKINQENDI